MAIGRSFQESLQKALRSLETDLSGLNDVPFPSQNEALNDKDNISGWLAEQVPERILRISTALRCKVSIEDISKIPEGKIFATQWNDGPAEKVYDDYYTDTLGTRVPPGDGQFLLKEMLDAIQAANCIAPVGLEVPSTSLWTAPIDQAALASITGMKNIMGLL